MASIRNVFRLAEMARSRGEPMWQVVDWAAQQTEPFTIKDMYREYMKAGGDVGETSFHTMANKLIAKYDPNSPKEKYRDEAKYGLSEKRPLVYVQKGRQGHTGEKAGRLAWGLDRPLREPRAREEDDTPEQEAYNDAMDRLEQSIGGDALRSHLARWKKMQIHQAVVDIRKTIPKRSQMDALHVASAELVSTGKANMDDVEDAENELEYAPDQPETQHTNLPDAPGATSQRPAGPAKADPGASVRKKAAPPPVPQPEPEEPEEIEPEYDEEDPSHFGGGLTIPKQFFKDPGPAKAAPQPEPERNPGREPEQEPAPTGPRKSPLAKFFKRK